MYFSQETTRLSRGGVGERRLADIFDHEHHMTKEIFSLSYHETERFLYLTVRPRDNLVVGWGEGGAVEF